MRKTCGIGVFYRNYRLLLEETLCLGAGFLSVCLETPWHLSGLKNVVQVLSPGTLPAQTGSTPRPWIVLTTSLPHRSTTHHQSEPTASFDLFRRARILTFIYPTEFSFHKIICLLLQSTHSNSITQQRAFTLLP